MRRRLAAAAAALLLAGCDGDEQARVVLLEPGWRVELLGTPGQGFVSPDGLLWHDGSLLMADESGGAVRRWTPGGASVALAGAEDGLSSPEDLARDAAGRLYVTDDNAGGVRRIDPDGRVALVAGPESGLGSTEGIAVAPWGAILVGDADGRRIVAIAADGALADFVPAAAGIAKPESLAFDGRGNLYIADNEAHVLYLRTFDGRIHAPIRDRAGFSPESIAYAGGALYITDSRHHALYRYRPEDGLEPIAAFAGVFANVQGIAADPAGNLYLSIRSGPGDGRGYVLRLARR